MEPGVMRIELINTGTELLIGQTLNTHVHWIGGELFALGLRLARQTCVPDGAVIGTVIEEAMKRSDVILVTGGLGPTSDDETRERVADLLALPLERDEAVVEAITAHLASRHRELTVGTLRQALVPRGAIVLENPFGTAPGLHIEPRERPDVPGGQGVHLFLLPGPPRELYPMFRGKVIPRLESLRADARMPEVRYFRLYGVGESRIAESLEASLRATGIEDLGYCVPPGEVVIRCVGSRADLEACGALIREAFPEALFAEGESTMEHVVIAELRRRREFVATAESCTGGLLAHRLTNVPGASDVFGSGIVSYANEAKSALLGVPANLIAERGAVSDETARAMATGILRVSGADHALAVTGIAGPAGGTPEKPVGTVFIALASRRAPAVVLREFFPFEREMFKVQATQAALNLLRRRLAGFDPAPTPTLDAGMETPGSTGPSRLTR
jgi:nicotinamide-nucleotide amidase